MERSEIPTLVNDQRPTRFSQIGQEVLSDSPHVGTPPLLLFRSQAVMKNVVPDTLKC